MNKYLKNLNRIEFVITAACTGRCKHCSQGDHKSSDNIDKYSASNAVREIAYEYSIDSVMTFGGEPLLFPETVYEIHKTAKEMNIPKRQLITNGYFGKDSEKIKLVADMLAESGVNEILLSVDAFHQETIPLDYVMQFAEAVIKNDMNIKVHPAWLASKDNDNGYNQTTKALLAEFDQMGIETGEGNVIFPAGNALKYFGEHFDPKKEYTNPYREDPADIRAICIGPDGDVLGENIYNKNILDILSSYVPVAD